MNNSILIYLHDVVKQSKKMTAIAPNFSLKRPNIARGQEPVSSCPLNRFIKVVNNLVSITYALSVELNSTTSGSSPALARIAYSTKPITKAMTGAGEMKLNFSPPTIGRIATTNPTAHAM